MARRTALGFCVRGFPLPARAGWSVAQSLAPLAPENRAAAPIAALRGHLATLPTASPGDPRCWHHCLGTGNPTGLHLPTSINRGRRGFALASGSDPKGVRVAVLLGTKADVWRTESTPWRHREGRFALSAGVRFSVQLGEPLPQGEANRARRWFTGGALSWAERGGGRSPRDGGCRDRACGLGALSFRGGESGIPRWDERIGIGARPRRALELSQGRERAPEWFTPPPVRVMPSRTRRASWRTRLFEPQTPGLGTRQSGLRAKCTGADRGGQVSVTCALTASRSDVPREWTRT